MSEQRNDIRLTEPEELASVKGMAVAGGERGGGVIAIRIYFEVEGFGSFIAGPYNTAQGHTNAWVGPGMALSLSASAASGWKFSHWTLNGNFAGTNPQSSATARMGLKIKAHFVEGNREKEGEMKASANDEAVDMLKVKEFVAEDMDEARNITYTFKTTAAMVPSEPLSLNKEYSFPSQHRVIVDHQGDKSFEEQVTMTNEIIDVSGGKRAWYRLYCKRKQETISPLETLTIDHIKFPKAGKYKQLVTTSFNGRDNTVEGKEFTVE